MNYKILKDNVIVIIGGGITGLLAGLIWAEQKRYKVIIIEKNRDVGGLLGKINYKNYGIFDIGMHTMFDTGNKDLDKLLFSLLPEKKWQISKGNKRDLAGCIFNNKVQYHSPFIDLRNLNQKTYSKCMTELLLNLNNLKDINHKNASVFLNENFGNSISKIIEQILFKQFGIHSKLLDKKALNLTTLSRVILFNENLFSDLICSEELRNRVAWPEQRTLPQKYSSGKKTFYPSDFGIYRVILALKERFLKAGGKIYGNHEITEIKINKKRVNEIIFSKTSLLNNIKEPGLVIWTLGVGNIVKLFGLNEKKYKFQTGKKITLVNILLNEYPNMKDLHYLYDFQLNSKIFRITNFSAYCKKAKRKNGWPISIELWSSENNLDFLNLKKEIVNYLIKFKIIKSKKQINFFDVKPFNVGFPLPSLVNENNIVKIAKDLEELEIENFIPTGILSDNKLFFQSELLRQVWEEFV